MNRRCPKCGDRASYRYNPGTDVMERASACGYTWWEDPLDRTKKDAETVERMIREARAV